MYLTKINGIEIEYSFTAGSMGDYKNAPTDDVVSIHRMTIESIEAYAYVDQCDDESEACDLKHTLDWIERLVLENHISTLYSGR